MISYLKIIKDIKCPDCKGETECVVQRICSSKNQMRRHKYIEQKVVGFKCYKCNKIKKINGITKI